MLVSTMIVFGFNDSLQAAGFASGAGELRIR